MTDYVIHSIDLDQLPPKNNIQFTEAQWWDDKSPLVAVSLRHFGKIAKLRMDLDKRNFIDHLTDPLGDATVREFASSVWEIVVKERFHGDSSAVAAAAHY